MLCACDWPHIQKHQRQTFGHHQYRPQLLAALGSAWKFCSRAFVGSLTLHGTSTAAKLTDLKAASNSKPSCCALNRRLLEAIRILGYRHTAAAISPAKQHHLASVQSIKIIGVHRVFLNMTSHAQPEPIMPSKPEDWNGVYDLVYQLYLIDDRTLEDTMKIMRENRNFCATLELHPS